MPEKYKYCPQCSQPLEDNGSCPGCSYGHRRQVAKPSQQQRVCAFNDYGISCNEYGYLSQTTYGEGPWYCGTHFARIMGWPVETGKKPLSLAVEEITKDLKEPYRSQAIDRQKASGWWNNEPMSEVDKRVNKLVPRLDGESEHDWSMRCRDWTLDRLKRGRILKPLREPGEDETEGLTF